MRPLLWILRIAVLLLGALSLPNPGQAQERSLYWPEVAVRLQLDAAGTLHVVERQTIRFDGDWNGGERRFRLFLDQDLTFLRLVRIDDSGEHPLQQGNLDEVDQYAWKDGKTLRWRSRRLSDPPFHQQDLVYQLEYDISHVLRQRGDSYHLAFNAAFPERSGRIEKLVVDLAVDPIWQPRSPLRSHVEQRDLAPGEDFLVEADLAYQGAGAPAGVQSTTPVPIRSAFFAAALLAAAAFYAVLRRRETALDRYATPDLPPEWDEAWLREKVFAYRAEEVGALWDRSVGPPEVAATLSRLVGEGKLASQVLPKQGWLGKEVLQLSLVSSRNGFVGYENQLVDKLFFGGRTTVTTEEVRAHYKSTGFDPAEVIRPALERRLESHAELADKSPPPGRRRTGFLFLAALALFALDAVGRWRAGLAFAGFTLLACVFFYVFAVIAAVTWRKRVRRLDLGSLSWILPGLMATAGCAYASFGNRSLQPGLAGNLALACLVAALWSSLTNNAQSREGTSAIRRRQVLTAARDRLRAELRTEHPRVQDDWFPYLLAFGLAEEVDRWFRSFGGSRQGGFSPSYSGGSSSSGGGGGWTGGGGAFGGAGASASWAAAATGLAAGVSAPSSSSGGGGGGSSGGGGGGGW